MDRGTKGMARSTLVGVAAIPLRAALALIIAGTVLATGLPLRRSRR